MKLEKVIWRRSFDGTLAGPPEIVFSEIVLKLGRLPETQQLTKFGLGLRF